MWASTVKSPVIFSYILLIFSFLKRSDRCGCFVIVQLAKTRHLDPFHPPRVGEVDGFPVNKSVYLVPYLRGQGEKSDWTRKPNYNFSLIKICI